MESFRLRLRSPATGGNLWGDRIELYAFGMFGASCVGCRACRAVALEVKAISGLHAPPAPSAVSTLGPTRNSMDSYPRGLETTPEASALSTSIIKRHGRAVTLNQQKHQSTQEKQQNLRGHGRDQDPEDEAGKRCGHPVQEIVRDGCSHWNYCGDRPGGRRQPFRHSRNPLNCRLGPKPHDCPDHQDQQPKNAARILCPVVSS